MNNPDEIVHSVIEAYRQAVFDQDTDAFMRLYHPGVRVFDSWEVWSYENADDRRKSVHGWLSTLGEDRVRVTAEDVQVWGERPMLVASAVFGYAAFSSAGVELRSMQNRLTWVLRPDVLGWKIVHEHTSLPVRGEDAKAIFKREQAS
jgi:ketosteroid isomerase-like protein